MTKELSGIERVPLTSLKRYLAAAGWRHRILSSGLELFVTGTGDEEIEIVLPAAPTAKDLFDRLTAAISTLSALERRDTDDVIASIRSISYDLVLSRLPDAAIRRDTIKLGIAEEFIRRMTRMLAAAAHGELHNSPYFSRIDLAAQKFAEDCRFGHTFRGSFGFTVESPVGPRTGELVDEEVAAPPLERRSVRRLARGLRIVENALLDEDPSKIVSGYQSGLNANACDELAALAELPGLSELKFEVIFSPEWGFPPDLGPSPAIGISTRGAADVIREGAKALRFMNYEKMRNISGKVRTLHSLQNPSDLFAIAGSQDVVVEWESEEFGKKNIRVSLGPEDYLLAVEAHRLGQAVSITGELDQESRQWKLENPRDFTLM